MPSHTRPLVFGFAIMIMSTFLLSVLLVFSSASLPIAQSLEDKDFDDSPVDFEDMVVDEVGGVGADTIIVQEYPYYFSRLTRAVVGGLMVMTFGFLIHMGYYCDRRDMHDAALKVGMPPSTSTSTYYAYEIVIICTLFLASVFLVSSHHSITGNPGVDNAEAPAPVFLAKTTIANSSLITGNETVANETAVNETTKTLIQNVTADTTTATPTTSPHSEMSLVIAVIIMVIVLLVALVDSEYLADRRTHAIVERIRMVVMVSRSPDNTKHVLTTFLICTIVVGVVLVVGIATLSLIAATMAKSPAKTRAVDVTTTTEATVASTLFAKCPDPTILAVAAFMFMIFLIVLFYFVFVPFLLRYVDHDGYAVIGKKEEKAPLEKVAVKF